MTEKSEPYVLIVIFFDVRAMMCNCVVIDKLTGTAQTRRGFFSQNSCACRLDGRTNLFLPSFLPFPSEVGRVAGREAKTVRYVSERAANPTSQSSRSTQLNLHSHEPLLVHSLALNNLTTLSFHFHPRTYTLLRFVLAPSQAHKRDSGRPLPALRTSITSNPSIFRCTAHVHVRAASRHLDAVSVRRHLRYLLLTVAVSEDSETDIRYFDLRGGISPTKGDEVR